MVLRLFTSMILFCVFTMGYAQNEITEKTRTVYAQIVVQQKLLGSKMKISIDYGDYSSKSGKYEKIRDSQSGKVKKFNSQVDGLNYMADEGWEFVSSNAIANGSTAIFYYLLKREVAFKKY